MNVNHHQIKRDRSYFEWGDNMQITCKGKGEIAMTESELVDFFSVTWRKLNYRPTRNNCGLFLFDGD